MQRPLEHLRWQGRKLGLLEIGYHLIIDRPGWVHRLRPIDAIGSHAPGYNHLSIAICLVGGINEHGVHVDNFTTMQRESLIKHCAGFMVEWPDAQICGHSELQRFKGHPRQCPNIDMNMVRADTMAFKMEDLACRTLTDMVSGRSDRRQQRREAHDAERREAEQEDADTTDA